MDIINGIKCKYTCSANSGSGTTIVKEDFARWWSNATQWPNQTVPRDGDDAVVEATWNLNLDIDTAVLNQLTILGNLIFNDTRGTNKLTANNIWINGGNLTAGNATNPFENEILIAINGN